ncbi:HIT family protein [Ahniella affigens]|uniref:HIT family protein n=1 Tax=Ahniella affigens TaxID=2021234 RepID=A0A2P1PNR8_9GAMM|nr:HIT family protein [Ahniella affigens]AVP96489.1 HIT family protein [Ahniella affigens]
MTNETITKFGYPRSMLREYQYWVVLLRPAQFTAGNVILACKSESTALGSLGASAFSEMSIAVNEIEATLRKVVNYEKVNYLALMMVDPHIHFHVIPRYCGTRVLAGTEFSDASWPRPPDLSLAVSLAPQKFDEIAEILKRDWVVTK